MNPWQDFEVKSSNAVNVHPDDVPSVSRYNAKCRSERKRLSTHMLPEPWTGSLSAPVVVLLANPGATAEESNPTWRPSSTQLRFAQQTLTGESMDFPFYWLHPSMQGSDGGKWYSSKLRWLIKATSPETVANRLLTLETHAYHSRNFDPKVRDLPTQAFQAEILRSAIQRGALIVALRAEKSFWNEFVPELVDYARTGRVIRVRNRQQAALSPGNLDQFDLLVESVAR